MNYNKIKYYSQEKNISLKEICGRVGISEQGLQKMINTNSIKVKILEKISEVLDISICSFFDESATPINNADKEAFLKEIEYLKKENELLNNAIKDKIFIIEMYKNKCK